MKISVIYNDRFPSRIAHGVYLAKLCSSLASSGAEVELIAPKRFNEVPEDPFLFYDVKKNFRIIKIWGFDFLIFARQLKWLAYWFQAMNFYLFLFAFMLFRSRSRIIYTMDYMGPLLKILGYRVVFESHGGMEVGAAFFRPLSLWSDLIVGTNSFIVKTFVNCGYPVAKTLVAPNGVDLEKFNLLRDKEFLRRKLNLPEKRQIIGYVGRLKTAGKGKGVPELVQAFSTVIAAAPRAFLMIVGMSESESKDLENLFKNLKVGSDNYKIFLQVTQAEMPDYLLAADILVMNYPKKEHYEYFMSPMKMFEYIAAGKAIVSTDLPSVREVLNESNSVLVRHDDISSLALGILKVLNDPILAEKISKQAKKDAASYSWDIRAQKIIDFIGRLF